MKKGTAKGRTAGGLLREVGPFLFDDDPDWPLPLADAWEVKPDTIWQWQRPSSPLNHRDHPALPRLLAYAEKRAEETAKAAALLREWMEGKSP